MSELESLSMLLGFSRHQYMDQGHPLKIVTRVRSVEQDEKGRFLLLEDTIFHPQGGGQRADRGTIGSAAVLHVEKLGDSPVLFEVKHYVDAAGAESMQIGQEVALAVDPVYRHQNSCLHSAGHLIAALLEMRCTQLQAVRGHHYPGEARVEFQLRSDCTDMPVADRLRIALEEDIKAALQANLPLRVIWSDGGRKIQIGEYPAVPCGGTHVDTVADLEAIPLRGVKAKRAVLSVGYAVIEACL